MKINFDYYRNLEKVDLFLCNPDGRELFVIPGRNRRIHLRFNDLSELTFDVDAVTTLSDHKIINLEAYDYIQTKRLIYATGIGWFQIEHVDEYDDGVTKYKTVTAESGQAVFKNKGFISEERVYCFYNPADPQDDFYDSSDDSAIPSVMGQWSKQLGIKQALLPERTEPSEAFEDWTVTYIDPGLTYQGETGVCRTFDENVTYGYDWIANTVSSAFEVVVLFDFLYKTIHVLRPDKATQKTNVIYTFNNFMRQVNVTENAEDIVTVLNCNGNNCDITAVNPTGTNYICDFSYFMDTIHYRWMSEALIQKLNQWKKECDEAKESYSNTVQKLRSAYLELSSCETSLKDASLHLQDLRNAQSKRYTVGDGEPGTLCGTVCAETVGIGQRSLDSASKYYDSEFNGSQMLIAYKTSPKYDDSSRAWKFSGDPIKGTADDIVCANLSDSNMSGVTYWYFSDASDESSSGFSYCRLKASTKNVNGTLTHYCSGFERYIAYTYPRINSDTGATEYTDNMPMWINIHESNVNALSFQKQITIHDIDTYNDSLHAMASSLNIVSYFSNTPDLLRELNCYWIEGDYTNDNIAVLDTTTPAEEIDLANELMSAGYTELQKMCQPRFSFSLDAIDATKIPEFASQMRMLELGKIVTIEKDEGLWYYPALLSIEMDLDHTDDFRMEFANALRLDDWGYTYADLIASAASTSRKISANWQDLSSYAKDKDTISSLIQDPLDATLRASFANMVNQEFVIDKTGILGRKFANEGESIFEQEQVRLINNLLIFTDDGWQTAKTALGKIYYTDEKGNNVTSYGLIAETLIGSIIIGETVKVRNENNSVLINEDGITITNNDAIVFQATTKGTLKISNYVSESTFSDYQTDALNSFATRSELDVTKASISAKVSAEYLNQEESFGWELDHDGFIIYSSSSSGAGAEILFSEQKVDAEMYIDVNFQLIVGQQYRITHNGQSYLCEAKYIGFNREEVFLGNTKEYDGNDTGEPFVIHFVPADAYIHFKSYNNSNTSVTLGISIPGSGTGSIKQVLTVDKNGLQVNGRIDATSGTLEDLYIYGKLYFGKSSENYYIDGGMTSAFSGYYINLPGFQVSEDTAIFSGELKAASGTFSGELKAGESLYPFTISDGADKAASPCIYSIMKKYAGSGGYGSVANNRVYIGGDGFSYWLYEPKNGNDYATSIRPGIVFCSGDANRSGTQFTAIAYKHDSITFTYGGTTNPRAMTDAYNYYVAKMSINSDHVYVDGKFNVSSQSYVFVNGIFSFSSGTSITSDRNKKHDIMQMDDRYGILFDSLLPITYKYNDGQSGRTHTGFIAQDVMSALSVAGLTTADFAAYVETLNFDGDTVRSLRYEEFVSLNTWQIQKLKARVAELERIVATLQGV